jgi:hypothetical protein
VEINRIGLITEEDVYGQFSRAGFQI